MALPPRFLRRIERSPGAQRRLVDVELIGVDGALHHRFAQAIGGSDEHHVAKAGFRVEREHDARCAQIAAHHVLHADRQRHCAVIEFVVHAIGYGAIVEQRGVHFVHGLEQMLLAAHVEESFLLAGEGGLRQIFGGCRGAHRDRELGAVARRLHLAPGAPAISVLQPGGEWRGQHPAADLRTHDRQTLHIIHIEGRERWRECVRRGRPARESRDRRARWWQSRRAPKHRGRPDRRSFRRSMHSCRRPVRRPCS